MKNFKGILFVLIAGSMWGCMGLLVRPLNSLGLQTMDIVALRSFETCLLTLITLPLLCKLAKTSDSSKNSLINDLKLNIKIKLWEKR